MTQKHFHHHIEEATGEPTVIELGEPYPEELGPALHSGMAHKGMRVIRECIEAIRASNTSTMTDRNKRNVMDRELGKIERTLDEYEEVCARE